MHIYTYMYMYICTYIHIFTYVFCIYIYIQVHPELVAIGYYYPAVSPHPASHRESAYEIHINGRSLHVAESSRLEPVYWDGKKRYLQTLFLEQAPTFRMGETGFIIGDADTGLIAAGVDVIRVEGKSLLESLSLMDLTADPLPKLHVMGHKERMSFRVVKVEFDAPAGTMADGARGKIFLNRNLTSGVLDGDELFVVVDRRHLLNTSDEQRLVGCDTPKAAHVFAVQKLKILADSAREAYSPENRHMKTSSETSESPPVLQLETAVFLNMFVPKNPEEAVALCPNISMPAPLEPAQRFQQQGWDQWSVFREPAVEACTELTNPAEVCASAREEGGTLEQVCPATMPPTKVSTFEYHLPVNNKWSTKYPIADRNAINDPEYLMDIVYDYHAKYDQPMVHVEDAFNTNQPDDGDIYKEADDTMRKKFFSGSLDYMGRPRSSGMESQLGNLVPASPPILSSRVVLKTAPYAHEDLMTVQRNGGGINWPWKNDAAVKTLLEGFEPLSIDFDFASLGVPEGSSKGLPLRPGYEYRFEAFVRLEPQLKSDSFGVAQVSGWRSRVVRKKASTTSLAPDEPAQVARMLSLSYAHTHTHTHTHTHIHIHTHTYAHLYTYTHTNAFSLSFSLLRSLSASLSLSLFLSLSLSLFLSLFLSLPLSFSLSPSLSFSVTHTHTLFLSHSPSLSLALPLSLSLFLARSLSLSPCLYLSLTHTRPHTHSLSLTSLSLLHTLT